MAGVDTVVGRGYIDTSRMYVSGCSGGGVLSSWVIGHTDRFAAAAVRCPVIDWMSMAGHTDVPLFTYSFFKKPFWEDPSDWLAHSSLMYGRQGDDADAADDGRARSPDADAADRGVLRGAEGERRAGEAAAVQRGVPRHRVEAVELHPHAALHDELVQTVTRARPAGAATTTACAAVGGRPVCRPGSVAWVQLSRGRLATRQHGRDCL